MAGMSKLILRQRTNFNSYSSFLSLSGRLIGCLVVIFVLFGINNSWGQNINEFHSFENEMKNSPDPNARQEIATFNELLHQLHSSVYIENNGIKSFGKGQPVCAYVDADALDKLTEDNSLFRKVQLITIRVQKKGDLSKSLDVATLHGFYDLKYIMVRCDFNCSKEQVEKLLTGTRDGLIICYEVSIPG